MKQIPSRDTKKFTQTNRSDILGNLWSTFGLDLETNLGAVRLSAKLVTNTTTTDQVNMGRPSAFEYFDDRWWAICGLYIYKNANEQLTSTFNEDASTNFQIQYDSDKSDLAVFNNRLWATTATGLWSKASGSGTGAWTSRDSLGSGVHKLVYFKKYNRLYYIDTSSKISSIDTSDVVANSTGDYFIDLGNTIGDLTTIVATSTSIFGGTTRISNSATGQAILGSIIEWDGISGQIVRDYPINNAAAILSMCVLNDVPYAVDSEGRVLQYTGHSFEEVARLPIDTALLTGATQTGVTGGRFIHFNGMAATKDGTILLGINNLNDDNGATINENLPSGIWEVDIETKSLTHKHPFTLKNQNTSTVTDYGQNRISGIGAIRLNTLTSSSSLGRGTILAGASFYTDATTINNGIFLDSPGNANTSNEGMKKGYLVSTWLEAEGLIDLWDKVFSKHKKLNSTDSIILKYRPDDSVTPTYFTATWVDVTSFTTTTDLTGKEGYEVEFIQGIGSGATPHIVSITLDTGLYTIVLDETFTGATGTSLARTQAWRKMGTISELDNGEFNINTPHTRVQVKLAMSFTGDGEFRELTAINKPYRKLE